MDWRGRIFGLLRLAVALTLTRWAYILMLRSALVPEQALLRKTVAIGLYFIAYEVFDLFNLGRIDTEWEVQKSGVAVALMHLCLALVIAFA